MVALHLSDACARKHAARGGFPADRRELAIGCRSAAAGHGLDPWRRVLDGRRRIARHEHGRHAGDDRFQTDPSCLRGRVLDGRDRGDQQANEIDFEPKALVSASPEEPGWSNLDITPSVEHPVTNTLDLVGEMTLGRTKQTDDLDTTEVTVRGGVRFHLFSRQRRLLLNETLPKRRLVYPGTWSESNHEISSDSNGYPSDSTAPLPESPRAVVATEPSEPRRRWCGIRAERLGWFIRVSDPTERFANR